MTLLSKYSRSLFTRFNISRKLNESHRMERLRKVQGWKLQVNNDSTERGIKLIQEYNNKTWKDDMTKINIY